MNPEPAPRPALVYSISGDDRIEAIEGEWDAFARRNGAADLTRERVLGSSIWQFIEGLEAVEIHRLLFAGVRERGLRVTLPFRCDGPRVRRDMEMMVSPLGEKGIEIRSCVVKEQVRSYVALLDASSRRSNAFVKVCSWCKKVSCPPHGWVEVEQAIREMRLLALPPIPQISHGMCEPCLQAFREQLERDRNRCH